jgi:hypothetical protein
MAAMVVSVTRLRLISLWSFPAFFWHAMASTRQIRRAPGFVGGWLGGEGAYGQWTATVWESEAAMRAYRNRAAHLKAMPRLLRWCNEAAFAHWEQDDAAVPSAEVAYARMASSGRVSKVLAPSPRHAAGSTVGDKRPRSGPILRPLA